MRRAIPKTFFAAFVLAPTAVLPGHGDTCGLNDWLHPSDYRDCLGNDYRWRLAAQLGGVGAVTRPRLLPSALCDVNNLPRSKSPASAGRDCTYH